jgi:hypothetical protein
MDLYLTENQRIALREKLAILLRESADLIDIWLAPGGRIQGDCFLNYDEEAHQALIEVLVKLG